MLSFSSDAQDWSVCCSWLKATFFTIEGTSANQNGGDNTRCVPLESTVKQRSDDILARDD